MPTPKVLILTGDAAESLEVMSTTPTHQCVCRSPLGHRCRG
jgi:hypothetical protein